MINNPIIGTVLVVQSPRRSLPLQWSEQPQIEMEVNSASISEFNS